MLARSCAGSIVRRYAIDAACEKTGVGVGVGPTGRAHANCDILPLFRAVFPGFQRYCCLDRMGVCGALPVLPAGHITCSMTGGITITWTERRDLWGTPSGPQIDYTVRTDAGEVAFIRSSEGPLRVQEICDRAWAMGLRWTRRVAALWFWSE